MRFCGPVRYSSVHRPRSVRPSSSGGDGGGRGRGVYGLLPGAGDDGNSSRFPHNFTTTRSAAVSGDRVTDRPTAAAVLKDGMELERKGKSRAASLNAAVDAGCIVACSMAQCRFEFERPESLFKGVSSYNVRASATEGEAGLAPTAGMP